MIVKNMQKYGWCMLCTIVLIVITACFWGRTDELPLKFCVKNESGSTDISVYESETGDYYVFIPAYAGLDKINVVTSFGTEISLGNIELLNGMDCSSFELEQSYDFVVDKRHMGELRFYQSANVATMYIDTVTGTMEHIHNDKNYQESASIMLYTESGELDCLEMASEINGHGNSTWRLEKKPYLLSFNQSKELLDMGMSEKWILLANGYDETNLRNKIVYDFADSIGTYSGWSPECRYVDLYLNGEYAGLYLLCKKIDVGSNNLDLAPEDYLFELTWTNKIDEGDTAFDICEGMAIDIRYPYNCNTEQKDILQSHIVELEKTLLDESGKSSIIGKSWIEYIDLESWARKYLIEEIFSNFDAGRASQYFWYDMSEGVIYAGPCWDYDLVLGKYWGTTWSTPYCMLAQRNWGEDTSWYYALWQKEEFRNLVKELYGSEFRPLIQEYLDTEIRMMAENIEQAVKMEGLRWPNLYEEGTWKNSVDSMITYYQEHIEFLDSQWLDDVEFCAITLQATETYNLYVKKNTICASLPQPDELGGAGVWFIEGDDKPYDITQPVNGDIKLIAVSQDENTQNKRIFAMREYITFLSIAMIASIFVCLLMIDFSRRRKEKYR